MVRDQSAFDEERMLQTLAMRGYRGFESYRLINLARVNLVVGKNNAARQRFWRPLNSWFQENIPPSSTARSDGVAKQAPE